MKLRRVKPDSIQVPEVRVTARFDDEMWEQFRSSIKEVGAIAPIICIENEQGLFLVDGLHRLVEAKKNGEQLIDVAVMPGDEVDVLTKNLFLDHLRGKPPVSEMIKVIKVLTEEYHLDSEAIGHKTGLTRGRIEQLQELSQLTPFILEELDEGRLTIGKAHILTKIKDPVTQETVARQAMLYPRWTIFELEEYVDGVLGIQAAKAARPPEAPAEAYMFKCDFCGGEYEAREIANPRVCINCSSEFHSAIIQARREAEAEVRAKDKGQNS